MKEKVAYLAVALLAISSCFTPLMAQQDTVIYNIHIDIICLACPLSNIQVTLNDSSGRVVAERTIPDIFEITLTYTTTIPVSLLTVHASGVASIGSYSSRLVSGSSVVPVGYGGDYWTAVQLG